LHGMGVLNGSNEEALAVAVKALQHPAAGVRKAAIEVLPKTPATLDAMVAANVFKDADLRVRLAATLALIDTPPVEAMGALLVDMADQEENISDLWLRHALVIASNLNSDAFQAAFRSRGLEENPALMNATLAQRLAYGPRLHTVNLRRTFGRQASTEAPEVMEKEILISGEVDRAGRGGAAPLSGMVAAQGNRTNGYGLYVLEDILYFHINQDGKVYQVKSAEPVPATFTFKAGLQKDGTMRLLVNEKEVATGKAAGLFKKDLDVPLRIGADMRKGMERIIHHPDSMFFLRAGLNNAKLELLGDILVKTEKGTVKVDQVIKLTTVKDIMKFNRELITAKAGTTIQIVLDNIDYMQHNLVLIHPNTLDKVGAAADQMVHDQDGAKMAYVPKMPEVIGATTLVNPGETYTLTVTLPATPGDYPYVCTFPGHWRMMNGILRVTP
jgi:azurin